MSFYTFIVPNSLGSLSKINTVSDLECFLEEGRNYFWMPYTFNSEKSAKNAALNYLRYYTDNSKKSTLPIVVRYIPDKIARKFNILWATSLDYSLRCYLFPPIAITVSLIDSTLDLLRKQYSAGNRGETPDEKRSLLGVNEHRSPSLTTSSSIRRHFAAGLFNHDAHYHMPSGSMMTCHYFSNISINPMHAAQVNLPFPVAVSNLTLAGAPPNVLPILASPFAPPLSPVYRFYKPPMNTVNHIPFTRSSNALN